MDERKKSEKWMKEKKVKQKTDWKTTKNVFSGCLIFCEKKVNSERINKEFHEEFQNKTIISHTNDFKKTREQKK